MLGRWKPWERRGVGHCGAGPIGGFAARPKISNLGASRKCVITEAERKQTCPLRRLREPEPILRDEALRVQTLRFHNITGAPECILFVLRALRKLNGSATEAQRKPTEAKMTPVKFNMTRVVTCIIYDIAFGLHNGSKQKLQRKLNGSKC